MYRGLAEEQPRKGEEDYTFQFEAPHFITLGLLYEENKRFAGGAFAPILKRVDKFLAGTFAQDAAAARRRARSRCARPTRRWARWSRSCKKRGINHPFVKNYVLARTTPLTRQRKTVPSFDQAFAKLIANMEAFDSGGAYDEIRRAAHLRGAAASSD